jgi:translation initiation factor 4E
MKIAVMDGKPLHFSYVFWYMRRGKGITSTAAGDTTTMTTTTISTSTIKEVGESTGVPGSSNTRTAGESTSSSSGTSTMQDTEAISTVAAHTSSTTSSSSNSNAVNPYESSIKEIATVSTVEEFWTVYDWLNRPNELPNTTDFHFFRKGIKPTWEDPENVKGGKWLIRLKKGLASRYWEEILLAMVGQQFHGVPAEEINGAVVSIRFGEDIISVWNRTAFDRDLTDKIRDCIKKILRLPSNVHMEYKPHQASLQDKSSFRNTMVWKPKSERAPAPLSEMRDTRRSNSWGEREKPKRRDIERAWR